MMHEPEYKSIIEVYKQLRKESVIFPLRDPKNQFLINFNGKKSPIFETIESGHIYEEPNKKLTFKNYKVEELTFTDDLEKTDYRDIDRPDIGRENSLRSKIEKPYCYSEPVKDENKTINTSELDSLLELMSGILTNPKEFIQEDGQLIR